MTSGIAMHEQSHTEVHIILLKITFLWFFFCKTEHFVDLKIYMCVCVCVVRL